MNIKNLKIASVFLVLILCISTVSGCRKLSEDDYYWQSYWEEKEITIDNSDTSSEDSSNEEIDENEEITFNPNDKPSDYSLVYTFNPIETKTNSQSDALRNKIMTAKDNLKITGTKYYVSNNGNDSNDGTSPATAWKTIDKLQRVSLKEGDAVLFERGGVFRGTIKAKSGITYAAYGEGDKPAIYQSPRNCAETEWASAGENIWVAPGSIYGDAGIVIFNHGELVGTRKFSKKALQKNGDFFCANNIMFLYMNRQPSLVYDSIEIGIDAHIILIGPGVHDVRIDNLTLKYTGAHAISAQGSGNPVNNISITNCEIGWIGGSILNGYESTNVRYGNGFELWSGGKNILVENCWVYQIYDSALSHQGRDAFTVENLTFKGNLLEYYSMSGIEYWAPTKGLNALKNIDYSDNIFRFQGYGWGELDRPSSGGAHIGSTANDHYAENFVIKNNVFDTSKSILIGISSYAETLPKLIGNTYAGKPGQKIGAYASGGRMEKTYFLTADSAEILQNVYMDEGAKVIIND